MMVALGLIGLVLSAPAAGQTPLAERLPAGTLVYYAWAGRTEAFAASPMGKLAEGDKVADIFGAVRQAMRRGAPGATGRTMVDNGWAMASILWKHPCTAALIDVSVPERGEPLPSAAMLADLGDDKPAFAEHLDKLVAAARADGAEFQQHDDYTLLPVEGKLALTFGFDGNVFFACLGTVGLSDDLLAVRKDKSLAANESFAAAMDDVAGEGAQLAVYVDVARLQEVMKDAEANQRRRPAGDDDEGMVPRLVRAFGLQKASAMAAGTRFVDGDVYTRTRLLSPAPHTGLLRLASERTITVEDLAALPSDADYAATSSVAPQSILDELRRGLAMTDQRTAAEFDDALAALRRETGVSLEQDLLAALGRTWVACSAESQGGFLTGTAIWTSVRDRERLDETIDKLEAALRDAAGPGAAGGMPNRCPRCHSSELTTRPNGWVCARCGMTRRRWETQTRRRRRVEIKTMNVGETEVRYVSATADGVPLPVAPAWAVHEGRFILAAWPQVIQSIIRHGPPLRAAVGPAGAAEDRAAPLTDSETFARIRAHLADEPAILVYMNTPAILRRIYPAMLVGGTMGLNALDSYTPVKGGMDWLPTLQQLERFLGPAMVAISADEKGLLYEEYATVPGQGLLAAPAIAPLTTPAAAVGIVRARRRAQRSASAMNLRHIMIGIHTYAANNVGKLPPSLAALGEYGTTGEMLVSPSAGGEPPRIEDGQLVGNTDYVYVPGLSSMHIDQLTPGIIVAYEKPECNRGEGTNVAFGDASVRWMEIEEFRRELKRTEDWLARHQGE
ncbi:MAG: hypothetical protein ACOC8F_02260 [Planctomycetota bacterium]